MQLGKTLFQESVNSLLYKIMWAGKITYNKIIKYFDL